MSQLVLLEETEASAKLTLNRPDQHNALVPDLLAELNTHLATLSNRTDLESVVLAANGRSFSTGGDVRGFWQAEERVAYSQSIVGALHDAILSLMALPCPLLANIHGPITGGSFGLMLAADLVAITERTFAQPYYSVVGFAPDGGWTAILPDRIGAHHAGRILSLNERLDAQALLSLGLADALCKESEQQIEMWLESLNGMAKGSSQTIKRLLQEDRLCRYRQGLDRERDAFIERITRPEVTEGMKKFLAL